MHLCGNSMPLAHATVFAALLLPARARPHTTLHFLPSISMPSCKPSAPAAFSALARSAKLTKATSDVSYVIEPKLTVRRYERHGAHVCRLDRRHGHVQRCPDCVLADGRQAEEE